MNTQLRLKIVEKFGTQIHFATALGEDESLVSKVIREWRDLPLEKKKKWADFLSCEVKNIFGKD